jgi:hypothetical protein
VNTPQIGDTVIFRHVTPDGQVHIHKGEMATPEIIDVPARIRYAQSLEFHLCEVEVLGSMPWRKDQ